jgi:hypothetical protein
VPATSTSIPITATSPAVVVSTGTPTTIATQGVTATQVPPSQNIAGVQALPRTGSTGQGTDWTLVLAGSFLALAGTGGLLRARRIA